MRVTDFQLAGTTLNLIGFRVKSVPPAKQQLYLQDDP